MSELREDDIEIYLKIVNWGIKNKYEVNFDADSNIKEYQHIEIDFETKVIKIS